MRPGFLLPRRWEGDKLASRVVKPARIQTVSLGGFIQPIGDCHGQCISDIRCFQKRLYRYVEKEGLTLLDLCMADCSTEESLLVIRGFGIQTSTSSSTYLSTASTRFIPTTQIQDIVIHEAFKGFEVRFYLAVIVEGEPNALVVFPVCDILSVIYSKLTL